jgi:large-conductance mechanosensitive channel
MAGLRQIGQLISESVNLGHRLTVEKVLNFLIIINQVFCSLKLWQLFVKKKKKKKTLGSVFPP